LYNAQIQASSSQRRKHDAMLNGLALAELRPRSCCWRSNSIVWSRLRRGRPADRFETAGRRRRSTRMILWWIGSDRIEQCCQITVAVSQ